MNQRTLDALTERLDRLERENRWSMVIEVKAALVFVALMLLSGCVRASGIAYPYAKYPPTDPTKVAVYRTIPPVPMEGIGEVSAEGAPAASWARVEEYLKEEAAKLGGDAVIVLAADQPFAGVYYIPGQTTASTFVTY